MLKILNDEEFDSVIEKGTWIVDFSATWCGPCKMLEPILDEVGKNYNVLKVDVDQFQDLAIKYGIMSVPSLLVFKDGDVTNRSIGYMPYDDIIDLMK